MGLQRPGAGSRQRQRHQPVRLPGQPDVERPCSRRAGGGRQGVRRARSLPGKLPATVGWPFRASHAVARHLRAAAAPPRCGSSAGRSGSPRYDRFEGKRTFNLNKLTQSCHGFNTMVGSALFERAGVPAAHSQYVRYYINGTYYHYMLRLEHMDDDSSSGPSARGRPAISSRQWAGAGTRGRSGTPTSGR